MNRIEAVEKLLKKHRYDKARVDFLENQLKRFTPEGHKDFIEYRMYKPGFSGTTPKFVMEGGEEVAELNKVEVTADDYRERCHDDYISAKVETKKELRELKYNIALIEDCLGVLGRVQEKCKIILEAFYLNNIRMEDIADMVHISRSRCYELCKEGLAIVARIIYGEKAAM